MRIHIFALILILLATATGAQAQPLADRVPDDAILYIGWSGSDNLPAEYAQSHLKAVLDNSRIRELFTQFFPQVAKKIAEKEPDAEEPLRLIMGLAAPMWRHPTALFATVDLSNPDEPMPKVALLCNAGKQSAAIHKQVTDLLAQAGDMPVPVGSFEQNGLVAVVLGYDDAQAALPAGGGAALAASAGFAGALKQVQSAPVCVFYFDVEKLLAKVEPLIEKIDEPEAREKIPKAIEASGFRGLKRVISTSGFDGKDWMSMTFVEAPAPRTGLLSVMDGKPVSQELLKAIPADATFVATARIDPARLIKELKTAAGTVDPRGPQFIDMGLGAVQMALSKNPVTDILEPMGEDWAIYCSPTVAGNGILGVVAVNKLDDPAKAQSALPAATINLSNWIAVALAQSEAEVEIRARTTKINDLTVYYFGLPIVAPSWAMKDGNLYLGLYPQSAASGAAAGARPDKRFADNEKFQAVMKRLNVPNPVSFSFYDLPAVAGQGSLYQQWMLIARYGGIGDLFGVPLPEPLMPPLPVLLEHVTPAGSAAWIDDAGYHVKQISPFPGAKLLSEPGMIAGGGGPAAGALMVGILLPAMHQGRETADRVKCASNMRMIGQGMMIYSNDNQGNFPADLGTILKTQDITADVFVCPSGSSALPANWAQMTPDEMAQWANEESSYVYLGQGKTNNEPAETIVLFDRPGDHDSDGINALFADGHVEFLRMDEARERLGAQGVNLDEHRR